MSFERESRLSVRLIGRGYRQEKEEDDDGGDDGRAAYQRMHSHPGMHTDEYERSGQARTAQHKKGQVVTKE